MEKNIAVDWGWVKSELFKKERLGSSKGERTKVIARERADELLVQAQSLAMPKAVSVTKKIRALTSGAIEIEGPVIFSSARLPLYVKGATAITLFVVTIGGALEKEASRLMSEGDALGGYLLDRIGSFAVESLAESAEAYLRSRHASKDEDISMRLSPGYCDWRLEEQRLLEKVVGFSEAGVSLTEGCMMIPRKSISAIIAAGPKGVFLKARSQCALCDKKECDYRRRP